MILVPIRGYQATTRFDKSLIELPCRTAGAVAKLYEISCLFDTPGFNTIQDDCFANPPTEQQVQCLPSNTGTRAVFYYSPIV